MKKRKQKITCKPSKCSVLLGKLRENCMAIIAVAGVISILFAANSYLAKAEDLRMVELRLDKKIISDDVNRIDQRIYIIKERHGENPKDKTIKEELRDLEQKKIEKQKELDKKQ